MMRSLWTAASGMTSQQINVDNISNNLANVNTTAFKKERMEFKSLLYQTMHRADLDAGNQLGRPVNLQIGLGVMPIATSRSFTTGNYERTDNTFDLAIEGKGFFEIQRGDEILYTKDGSIKLSIVDDGLMLVTSEGFPLLSIDDEPIVIPEDVIVDNVKINIDGILEYTDPDGEAVELDLQIKIVQFSNIQGLEAVGSNLFKPTGASGGPLLEADDETVSKSRIVQGVLESSNVQVAEEMVKLIVAQRAYELNSKAIQTSDDMLQNANNLKR